MYFEVVWEFIFTDERNMWIWEILGNSFLGPQKVSCLSKEQKFVHASRNFTGLKSNFFQKGSQTLVEISKRNQKNSSLFFFFAEKFKSQWTMDGMILQ